MLEQLLAEADAVILHREAERPAVPGDAGRNAHGKVRVAAVHAVDYAVFHNGLENKPRYERVVYGRVGVYRPVDAAAEAVLLQLEIVAHKVKAAADACHLAAAVQAQPEELAEVVYYVRRRLVVVLERAPVGGVQHVIEEMRVYLHLEHGELRLLLAQLEHIVQVYQPAVFLNHVVENPAEPSDVVGIFKIRLGAVVALGETPHGVRELVERPGEHVYEYAREQQHGHEENADYQQCGAHYRGLAPEGRAVPVYDAAYKGRPRAGLVVEVEALAVKIGLVHGGLLRGVRAEVADKLPGQVYARAVQGDFVIVREQYRALLRVRRHVGAEQLAHVHGDGDGADDLLGVVIRHLLPQHQLWGVVHAHKIIRVGGDILPLRLEIGADEPVEGPLGVAPALGHRAVGVIYGDKVYRLAADIVKYHAQEVHLESGALEQLLRPFKRDGKAVVAHIDKLLGLG